MKKMISFGLTDGQYGVLEEKELALHVKQSETTIHKQEVASFYDCLEWSAMGAEIKKGMYIVSDGILNVGEEYDDFEFIDLRIVA